MTKARCSICPKELTTKTESAVTKSVILKPTVAARKLMPRDLIWMAIRKLKEFAWVEIEDETGVEEPLIKSYLIDLRKGGFVGYSVPPARYKNTRWELTKDIGVERPYVNRQGKQSKANTGRSQMWRALKVMNGLFNLNDLQLLGSTDEHVIAQREAKYYLQHLRLGGYIHLVHPRTGKEAARYMVIKSKVVGPRAPMVLTTRQVFDPNIGEIVWTEKHEEKE